MDNPLQLLELVKQKIAWVQAYENRAKSIPIHEQAIQELEAKRCRTLEFIEYHTRIHGEVIEQLEKKRRIIQQHTKFCADNEDEYIRSKNMVDPAIMEALKKSERIAERIEND